MKNIWILFLKGSELPINYEVTRSKARSALARSRTLNPEHKFYVAQFVRKPTTAQESAK